MMKVAAVGNEKGKTEERGKKELRGQGGRRKNGAEVAIPDLEILVRSA